MPKLSPSFPKWLDRLTSLRAVAGYSGTPLAKKLGIKPTHLVKVSHRPRGFDLSSLLDPLPDGARLVERSTRGTPDIVACFAESSEQLQARLPSALGAIARDGVAWIFWPKKSSERYKSGTRDLTEDVVRAQAIASGVVDVKVCAIDDTWSGLKLVYRLADR